MRAANTTLGYPLETIKYPHSPELSTADITAGVDVGVEFIRPIIHGIPLKLREATNHDLETSLAIVDQCFESVAIAVGTTVIPHRWLLTEGTNHRNQYGSFAHSNGLELFDLPGVWLAAKVPKLNQLAFSSIKEHLDANQQRDIVAQTAEALKEWRDEHGWSLKPIEYTAKQFMYALAEESRTVQPTTLVDIDILC